jgi:hypothetical protein
MATERSGAAVGDGVQRAVLSARQAMGASIVGGVTADAIGEFEAARALNDDAHRGGRRRRHDSGAGRGGEIEGQAGGDPAALGEMEVAGSGGEVTLAE